MKTADNNISKGEKFLMEILKKTQSKAIEWISISPENIVISSNEHIIGPCFVTTIKGESFRIYKFEYPKTSFNSITLTVPDLENWFTEIRFELFDKSSKLGIWSFSSREFYILRDLYGIIIQNNVKLDDFIDRFLESTSE